MLWTGGFGMKRDYRDVSGIDTFKLKHVEEMCGQRRETDFAKVLSHSGGTITK